MIKRTVRFIFGLICILVGTIGIIIPVMPGWTPLILGIILIHPPTGHRFKAWAERKKEQWNKWRRKG